MTTWSLSLNAGISINSRVSWRWRSYLLLPRSICVCCSGSCCQICFKSISFHIFNTGHTEVFRTWFLYATNPLCTSLFLGMGGAVCRDPPPAAAAPAAPHHEWQVVRVLKAMLPCCCSVQWRSYSALLRRRNRRPAPPTAAACFPSAMTWKTRTSGKFTRLPPRVIWQSWNSLPKRMTSTSLTRRTGSLVLEVTFLKVFVFAGVILVP